MTTSATPVSHSPTRPLSPSRWSPSGDDHLIYEWVKMQGKTQSEVASFFGINQSTVSRIVQRIERWQAHAKARENGRLDPKERLRAQRWLTYERNELILASCLRIAHEMEGFTELSKSTISRPASSPNQKTEIRTEGRTIDRHGVAARFLRLAYRINMDQLKLAELFAREGEAPAEPLTDEELAAELHQAALDAAELAAARSGADIPVCHEGETERPIDGEIPADPPAVPPSLCPSVTPSPPLHNLHNETILEITTTPTAPCTCRLEPCAEKNSPHSCIIDCDQPSWPHDTQARSTSEGPGSRSPVPASAVS
jgi:transcriptional regulator with XRE-family HTH domain